MKSTKIVCLTLIMLIISVSAYAADRDWNPDVPEGVTEALWTEPLNWDPNDSTPTGDDRTRISGTVECVLEDATAEFSGGFRLGYGGNAGALTIKDGGSIISTWGGWTGQDGAPGVLTIEQGGSLEVSGHWWNGLNPGSAGSTLILNGGSMWAQNAFDQGHLGAEAACYTFLNEGELNVRYLPDNLFWLTNGSVMDIAFGTFIVRSSRDIEINHIEALIDTGGIVAFGGSGTVEFEVINGQSIVTAISPLNPSPTQGEVVAAGDVDLQWTNLEGDPVVDIWFGSDPENLSKVVDGGVGVTSVQVNAPLVDEPTTYYWRIDSTVGSEVYEGALLRFHVTGNLPPQITITTPSMISWAGEPIQLNTELIDDFPEEVTYSWTAAYANGDPLDEPAEFYPSASDPNPTITVNYHASIFRVTVTVDDGFNEPVSASRRLDVAANPCQAARAIGLGDDYPADIAANCMHDLHDYANIASEWLTDHSLTEPIPVPED